MNSPPPPPKKEKKWVFFFVKLNTEQNNLDLNKKKQKTKTHRHSTNLQGNHTKCEDEVGHYKEEIHTR